MVKKIHTRAKRKFNLTSSFGHKNFFSGKTKKKGAKTFGTKESAEKYAKDQGLTKEKYILIPTKKGKRIKIEYI